jgi:hypothetical protein
MGPKRPGEMESAQQANDLPLARELYYSIGNIMITVAKNDKKIFNALFDPR